MPTPKPGESQQKFISRCMAYPDLQSKPQKQRAGECYGIWKEHHKKAKAALEKFQNAVAKLINGG